MPEKDKHDKRLTELPTVEAIAHLFPKEVIEQAQQVAHAKEQPRRPPPSS